MNPLAGLDTAELPADAIEVGRIVDAWGVKGWFKVLPHSADPQALFSSRTWFIRPRSSAPGAAVTTLKLPVRDVREHTDTLVAWSPDIADRSAAEALKGATIHVPRTSFPTPAPDEYYWVDLIGLDVINREGVALGRVVELLSTGPHSVLVLRQEAEPQAIERLIPFVAAYVDSVDLPGRVVRVYWQPDY